MKTITLKIDDRINEQFMTLLKRFSEDELKILEQSEYVVDDDYLRSIDGMIESIKEARKKQPKFGSAKGLIEMSDDFDETLADFDDYAP